MNMARTSTLVVTTSLHNIIIHRSGFANPSPPLINSAVHCNAYTLVVLYLLQINRMTMFIACEVLTFLILKVYNMPIKK